MSSVQDSVTSSGENESCTWLNITPPPFPFWTCRRSYGGCEMSRWKTWTETQVLESFTNITCVYVCVRVCVWSGCLPGDVLHVWWRRLPVLLHCLLRRSRGSSLWQRQLLQVQHTHTQHTKTQNTWNTRSSQVFVCRLPRLLQVFLRGLSGHPGWSRCV